VPVTASSNDSLAVELGMKFRADVAGTVTGVRFYKGSANTGIHTGHLWSGAGALLATVTFSGATLFLLLGTYYFTRYSWGPAILARIGL